MPHRQWRKRLAKLDELLPHPPTVDVQERQKRRRLVMRRLVRLYEQACALMTEGEQISVAKGFKQWAEARRGPYARWFRELLQGRCRLPELAPATMKVVGGVVVSRLRHAYSGVPKLWLAVPATARASDDRMEVVARQGASGRSASLVRPARLLPELSRIRGLELRDRLVAPGGSSRPTLEGAGRLRRPSPSSVFAVIAVTERCHQKP